MRKIIITLGLWFLVIGIWAQNDEGAKIVPVSQAINEIIGGKTYSIQVGVSYLGQNRNEVERKTNPLDIRFPWDVLYLFDTFSNESFDVSKGYFGDKILINWDLRSNFDIITSIKIYRREYREYVTPQDDVDHQYDFVASVSKSETSYEDKYTEGGVLYEYKVIAEGVSEIESLYSTYISGIGYRNPTAVITGNVSYEGGNPVKDVIIKANSDGSGINIGSSLLVPATSSIQIEQLTTPISDATTFQAWVKPENAFTNDAGIPINLFKLSNLDTNIIDITANLLATSKELVVSIGGSQYRIENYYPSGKLNSKGDDILIPVSNFNSSFIHFSVVMEDGKIPLLYINGRAISEAYKTEVHEKLVDFDPDYTAPYFDVTIPTQTNILSIGGAPTDWDDFYIGGQNGSFIDEIRIWKDTLGATTIRTDYSRYISGNDDRMVSYLSANEKVGSFAYDLSRSGFNYNKNHGKLWQSTTPIADKVTWSIGTGNFPTTDQLGILGVTDINGNYEITAIPYSGTGESFNITPLYGVHQFEPGQQLVFLGEGSEVVNKINFVDISSFSFKGKILYDTRGVFKSFTETTPIVDVNAGDEYIDANQIIGEGYNYYETLSNGKLSKGEYWYNLEKDRYEKYAPIYSEGVNIYVDGNIVLDENNLPVVSVSKDGVNGYFDIQAPIGDHYISVKKNGHEFKHEGRFPAESGTFKEFFEDSNEAVIFIDSTRVTLVGKVVGGSVEAAKTIGFGDVGLFEEQTEDENGNPKTITVSSINNIGIAAIKLGYIPPGSSESELETEFNFETNTETGEHRVSVLPLKYQIDQLGGIRILANNTINLIDSNETVDVSKNETATIPQHENSDGSFYFGEPYHYEKSFTYRTTPVLSVISQSSEATVKIDGKTISTLGFDFPIYKQFGDNEIQLKSFERYTNYDGDENVEDIVPIIDGEFKPTNNIAPAGSESANRDPDDESVIKYTFKGGMPSISAPFTRSLSIIYRINGVDYEAENYITEGIILGGQSDGSLTFITAAPDVPDIILRAPPGSNSFASIESGESISFTTEGSFSHSVGAPANVSLRLGMEFETGGGLAGPVIAADFKNSFDLGVQSSISSTDGNSITKTYTFNQTISTSDDPDHVGSDGDLYIGQSKNYFYGSFDDVQSSNEPIGSSVSLELTNSIGQSIFISKQKAMYFVEEPSETFFIHSQKHILETLIPGLQLIISNIENGIISEDDTGVPTKGEYIQQINLWRKIILDNERSKYLVKNDRSTYRNGLSTLIDDYNGEIVDALNNNPPPARRLILIDNLNNSNK